jgi:hypothetical protein
MKSPYFVSAPFFCPELNRVLKRLSHLYGKVSGFGGRNCSTFANGARVDADGSAVSSAWKSADLSITVVGGKIGITLERI